MSKHLEQLAEAQLQLNELRARITVLAVAARCDGASWIQIARAMGTTKQAANRRFSKYLIDAPSPGHGA